MKSMGTRWGNSDEIEHLAGLFAAGDHDALRRLLGEHKSYWSVFARREYFRRREPKICIQDFEGLIPLAVYETARDWDPARGRFKTLLHYKLLKVVKEWFVNIGEGPDKMRKNNATRPDNFSDVLEARNAYEQLGTRREADLCPTDDDSLVVYEDTEQLVKALSSKWAMLPAETRVASLLHYVRGLRMCEIAVYMRRSKMMISLHLARFRKALENIEPPNSYDAFLGAMRMLGHGSTALTKTLAAHALFALCLFCTLSCTLQAGTIRVVGRDIIGKPEEYTWHTGGTWCFSTEIPAAQTTWNWGHPALRFRAPFGGERLLELRTVLWADRYPNDGLLRWDWFDYWVDIWEMDSYLAGGDPKLSINVVPYNVTLKQVDDKTVIPSKIFGNAGTAGSNNDTYDFRFDLGGVELDRGWFIIGFQSHHSRYRGGMLSMSGSGARFGLTPYFSMDIPGSVEPPGVLGGQVEPWIYLRPAMQLTVEYTAPHTPEGDCLGIAVILLVLLVFLRLAAGKRFK